MTPSQQLNLSITAALDVFNATKTPAQPLALLASVHFALGPDTVVKATPAPAPIVTPPHPTPPPTNSILVGPSHALKSLDDVSLSQDGKTYLLERGSIIKVTKKQKLGNGVTIQSDSGPGTPARIDCAVKWKEAQYVASGSDNVVRDLILTGHDGAEFVNLIVATRFTMENVTQKIGDSSGGITPLTAIGSVDLTVSGLVTERTGRYSIYLGNASGKGNINPKILNCNLGPTKNMEFPGMGLSEHPFRCYGVKNLVVDNCHMANPNNPNGKQAMKIMQGDGALITNSFFDGSTRFGRDVNDPPGYTLKNVTVRNCAFTDWVRIDPGAEVSISDSKASAHSSGNVFSMQGGTLKVKNVTATYTGGKFANAMNHVDTSGGGNSFNGHPV